MHFSLFALSINARRKQFTSFKAIGDDKGQIGKNDKRLLVF